MNNEAISIWRDEENEFEAEYAPGTDTVNLWFDGHCLYLPITFTEFQSIYQRASEQRKESDHAS